MRSDTAHPTILLIHDGRGGLRGGEKVALDLIALLPGYRWCVLTNQEAFARAAEARGAPTHLEELRPVFAHGFSLADLATLLRQANRLRRLIRQSGAACVHVNNGVFSNWAVLAAWWCGVPAIAHLHSPLSRRSRLRLGVHAADRIVGVSRATLRLSMRDALTRRRCRLIHNGHAAARTRPPGDRPTERARLGIPEGCVVLGVVGVLLPGKRVEVAIAALRALDPALRARVTLLVVGDGPERGGLEELARGLPVIFAGQSDEVASLLAWVIDIFLLPSEMEAFSLALLEAAAAALPRIAADMGGNAEAIEHGSDGLLVPPGRSEAMAGAIAALLRDPDRARRLGAAAALRVAADFTQERFIAAFADLYGEVRRDRRGRARRIGAVIGSTARQILSRA